MAGTGANRYSGHGGTATNATLGAPAGVAIDPAGNLLIADTMNNRIRKVIIQGPTCILNSADLARKLAELEAKYDSQFKVVFETIRQAHGAAASAAEARNWVPRQRRRRTVS